MDKPCMDSAGKHSSGARSVISAAWILANFVEQKLFVDPGSCKHFWGTICWVSNDTNGMNSQSCDVCFSGFFLDFVASCFLFLHSSTITPPRAIKLDATSRTTLGAVLMEAILLGHIGQTKSLPFAPSGESLCDNDKSAKSFWRAGQGGQRIVDLFRGRHRQVRVRGGSPQRTTWAASCPPSSTGQS